SDRDGTWNIYIINADGTNVKQLTRGAVMNKSPSWSGDGKKIAFDRHPANVIVVMDSNGDNPKVVGTGLDPAISPDGEKILFARPAGNAWRLAKMDLDGTNVQELN